MIRILTHSPSGPPGRLRALCWWWLTHQQGRRGGPWGERNTAPHLDHIPQGLEALVTAPLHQQRHGEVASLEPLAHLNCGERTWWGRERDEKQREKGMRQVSFTDLLVECIALLLSSPKAPPCHEVPWISPCGSL